MADRAFVVMQVGADGSPERKRADEVFGFIIKPILEAAGIEPYRADLDPSPGSITPKMLSELLNSRLVIADLTGRNPNVFYELGIVHSFSRPLICIADSIASLPFDAKDERVIAIGKYGDTGLSYAQGEDAKKKLEVTLKIVVADGYEPPSPIRDVAGTQSLDALAPENPMAAELSAMRETLDEVLSRTKPKMVTPPALHADIASLRELLERQAAAGRVTVNDIIQLAGKENSRGQVTWAKALASKTARDPWQDDPETEAVKDPWATPDPTKDPFAESAPAADPWGAPGVPADEPPF